MSNSLRTLKRIAKQFAEQTSINGFGEILDSVHPVEALIWGSLVVTALYLTVRDCEAPIKVYLDEGTYSVVELTRNDTMYFPGATICVEIRIKQLTAKNDSRLIDAERLEAFSLCVESPSCYQRVDFFDEFYDEIVAASKLLWSYVVAEAGEKSQVDLTNSEAFKVPISFYRFLLTLPNSADSLRRALSYTFCVKMDFQAIYFEKAVRNNTEKDFCNTTRLTWFGVPPRTTIDIEMLCFAVGKLLNFTKQSESHAISMSPQNIYPRPEAIVNDQVAILSYLNPEDDPATTDRSDRFVQFALRECKQVYIEVTARIVSINKRRRSCSNQFTVIECIGLCTVTALADYCNCSSMSWRSVLSYPSALNSCFSALPPRDFERCGYDAGEQDTAKACRRACKHGSERCTITRVNLHMMPCDENTYPPGASTVLIYVKQFDFLTYAEYFSVDVPSLMSNLGGIFGLWLGAGFIGIIHAFTLPLKLLAAHFVARRKSRGAEAPAAPTEMLDVKSQENRSIEARLAALEVKINARNA